MSTLTPSQQQKNAILADLQTLVTSTVLSSAFADDLSKVNPLDRVWPGFPSVVVLPPILASTKFEDQQNNVREYTWYLNLVTTPANMPLNDPTYLEGLIDQVCALFDQDATLQGTANAGVYPTLVEPPGPVSSNNITYVVATISFKARTTVPAAIK